MEYPVEHLAHKTILHGGFHASVHKRYSSGRTVKSIAFAIKAKQREISMALRRLGFDIPDTKERIIVSREEVMDIISRFHNKESISSISRNIGRAQKTIHDHLLKNGLIEDLKKPCPIKKYGKCSSCGVEIVSNYAQCNYCMYKDGD